MKRRTFLEFLGKGIAVAAVTPITSRAFAPRRTNFHGIKPTLEDDVVLAQGLDHYIISSWGDAISKKHKFGFNNDFNAYVQLTEEEGILWTNHEYIDPIFIHGNRKRPKTKEEVDAEMYNVGGTIQVIRKEEGKWTAVANHPLNQRIHGKTMIPFNWDYPIHGERKAMGTLANCSGGITPWGTILTCEENYDSMYGERNRKTGERIPSYYGWEEHYDNPPEHYGWVVEIDPKTLECQKHVAMGRCSHECATMVQLEDGRLVVYSGDDSEDECLYKYVSGSGNDLKNGTLYVANLEKGCWESLEYEKSKVLKTRFKDQTDVLVRLREAAKLVGGTPLDRPEDIEIDPLTGSVVIALTNNKPKGNYYGKLLRITEHKGRYDGKRFEHSTLMAGGKETGFACPDNLAFDTEGNLWFTSDISGGSIGKAPYESFGNNGLFVLPRRGEQAGIVIQVASAPVDAEFTGPYFLPDGTLILSVQHPGERTRSLTLPTSTWNAGSDGLPRPAVIAITGLNK